ncbi:MULTISPECIES: GIY-YIG nuclease family protein [unclassified Flavobacterium]|jgi:putative endonuclease|uniref:GIY-YIG nuclease family protein n=1 Tax=unclassified Flavobacterium TaxID=196869 RepID=UPI0025BAE705|nr:MULTISPECIES: GIY-YIG nuclease family protein [unclassified Flavobacterium]
MFYTYIIYSKTIDKYYVGSCQNIQERLKGHLNSRSKYTKIAKDWELKYAETYVSRSEVIEEKCKSKK